MFKDSFIFELKYRLKSTSTWICFIGLLLMSYREMLAGEWDLLIQSGRVARNSPYTVYYLFMYYTFWAATIGCALMIPTFLRDIKSGTAEFLYSFPIQSNQYFLGKYCASILIFILVMSSVAVGFITMPIVTMALGTHPPTDFVVTPWAHIGHAFLLWIIPTCFVYGTLTFMLTSLTGRAGPVYGFMMLAVGLFVTITAVYGDGSPKSSLVQILDPLGKVTVEGQMYYWTAEERMNKFLAFEGSLMQNRLLYIGIGLIAFCLTWFKFDVRRLLERSKNRVAAHSVKKQVKETLTLDGNQGNNRETISSTISADEPRLTSSRSYWFGYALSAGWRLFNSVLTNKAFYLSILTLILMLVLAGFSYQAVEFEGSGRLLPKALILLPSLIYPSLIFTLVAAAFFSIEMCDREKSYRLEQLVESSPIPTWSIMMSKLVGGLLMAFILALIPISAVLIIQYSQGFFETNWALLGHVTLLILLPLMLAYSLISIICYALSPNKVLAQSIAVVMCITPAIFNEVKTIENFMYLWAWPFFTQLSDFDASGQYLARNISFAVYWLSLYFLLLVIAYLLWPRGTNLTYRTRWREAYSRLHPINIMLALVCGATFFLSAIDINQDMVVRNQFQTDDMKYADSADYELRYGSTRNNVQPKIIAAELTVDLYPDERRADYTGTLTLKNKANQVIQELIVNYAKFSRVSQLLYNQEILLPIAHDPVHRRLSYQLPLSLAPNETALLKVVLAVGYQGFSNDEFDYHGTIVADGSYFSAELWPTFGYDKTRELQYAGLRKKHGLLAKTVSLPLSKISDFSNTDDADFLTSHISISTDHNQLALASGKLISQKVKSDRATYVYQNNEQALWQPNMVSAAYQLTQETWQSEQGGQAVQIEVYHHPDHQYNVANILAAARQALTLGYSQWGEFPYQSLRIAEVPNGMTEARVNGNLLIIPEHNAWLHDYRQPPDVDWITFQIARDVSRVWWQQVAISDTGGHQLLTEAVPILQGLKAIKNKWSQIKQTAFVDLLSDTYLRERTLEDQLEASVISLTDEKYASTKALLALYSSEQLLGSAQFEACLKQLFNRYRGINVPPYLNTEKVFERLVKNAPNTDSKNFLLKLFKTTRHYDFQVASAKAVSQSDKKYQLKTELLATEFIYKEGKDDEIMYQGYAKIKVLGSESETDILFEGNVLFEKGKATLNISLSKKPARVIINSNRLFIERSPSNNDFSL